jgi:hypothetical protein
VGCVVSSANFLKFCQAAKITPDLLSNAECNRVSLFCYFQMFKACKRTGEGGKALLYLNGKEFVTAVAFLALYYYSKPENTAIAAQQSHLEMVQSLFKWISRTYH